MEEVYGLGFLRNHQEPYCFPMPLDEIDSFTMSHTKEEILKIFQMNDSSFQESNIDGLRIFKLSMNKWKDARIDYLSKEDTFVFTFSFEELFSQEKETNKILNILFNHFSSYLTKGHIRPSFKECIMAMKQGKDAFLESLSSLSYSDMRLIRTYLVHKIPIKSDISLDVPILERKAS